MALSASVRAIHGARRPPVRKILRSLVPFTLPLLFAKGFAAVVALPLTTHRSFFSLGFASVRLGDVRCALCGVHFMGGRPFCPCLPVRDGVLAARVLGETIGAPVRAPWLMMSVNDDEEDPHFRKAVFDPSLCPSGERRGTGGSGGGGGGGGGSGDVGSDVGVGTRADAPSASV